jgi:hypothetical protein
MKALDAGCDPRERSALVLVSGTACWRGGSGQISKERGKESVKDRSVWKESK